MSNGFAIKCGGAGPSASAHVRRRRCAARGPVLRQASTGLYFQGGASWTKAAKQALVFRDIEAAVEAGYNSRVAGLELTIFLFNDPRYTVRLNLDDVLGKPPRSGLPWSMQGVRIRLEAGLQRLN